MEFYFRMLLYLVNIYFVSEYTGIMVIWHILGLQAAYQFIDFQSKYCVFIPDQTLLLRLY